ncbi:MAG TPA: hypothetical protein VME47_15800, partial [Acetobacteraceae bacterium]|nr:hypothetical protein [Acetobacteraceae bacterium]
MSAAAGSRQRRRRRRHDSSPLRRTPEQLNQSAARGGIRGGEVLGALAVVVICAALIALIWLNVTNAITARAEDQRDRVEATLTAQATTLTMQVEHELQLLDQSLAIIQAAWNENPNTFRLDDWRKRMPALTAVSDDVFIANDNHIIVQDILPAAVGQGIGSAYADLASGSLEPIHLDDPAVRDGTLLTGEMGSDAVTRSYTMYMVRPLTPRGWLVGAAYQSKALTQVFAVAGLGHGGLGALVDTVRGGVQALAGSAAVRPRLAIANTPLYQTMIAHPDSGIWIGATPIDEVARIIAYHKVPGRNLVVLVGETVGVAMEPANSWAAAARSLAAIAMLLVIAVGGAIWWELWHWRQIRRRQRALAQTQTMLAGTQTELTALRRRSAADEMQVQALLPLAAAGVAVADTQDRLTRWNPRFVES